MDILDSKEENCEHEKHLEKVKNFIENQNSIDDICNLLKILGEPSRLKIVLALSEGDMCVYHIVKAVNSNQSAVSHQLRILRENKVIKSFRKGQNIVYSLDDEHIMQIINIVKTHVEE
ncbi:putative uncharacterized protein [Firmicutes bacterium CAG:449]|jgi:hypothetical protein|nr:putative uncharacterized protein [Firmicutes bacterium CAG:449]